MKTISLNGNWRCKPDYKNEGIESKWYDPSNYIEKDGALIDLEIPKSFNLLKGFETYEGVFWHFYQFNLESSTLEKNKDYIIRFKGCNYISKVWLNGNYLGQHEGGFIPFSLNASRFLKPTGNLLVLWTDNTRRKGQLPDFSFDWFNWGGIYRDVDLLILNRNRIKDVVIKTTLLTKKESIIKVSYKIIGTLSLSWQILDTDLKGILFQGTISEASGEGGFSLTFNNPKLWSPDTPELYYIKVFSTLPDSNGEVLFESTFGIRQIEVSGIHIYLNKKRLFMKGISLHEEYMPYGRTIPYEKREEDIKNMKSLGLNALRTAHYSHDEDLMNIADKLGMLILEEIPVYWRCDYKSKDVFKLAAKMMRSLIKRDINHPSVIWWSAGNEVPIEKRECARFFKHMMSWIRMHDDTRIVTYVSHRLICDLTRRHADVACINAYFGWYYGSPTMISAVVDMMRTPHFNKPWIYTEFGAGAKYGFRAGWKEQIKFSEELQLYVLDYTIRTLNAKDYMAGWFIWAYRDFRSFLRENQYQQGYNRKGIVSGERNERKLIYHRLPQIINEKRKLMNTKFGGIIVWILLFPLAYLLTYFLDIFLNFGQTKRIDSGKKIEELRLIQVE